MLENFTPLKICPKMFTPPPPSKSHTPPGSILKRPAPERNGLKTETKQITGHSEKSISF